MQQCNRLQHDLSLAIEDLRTTRGRVDELKDENQRISQESLQVATIKITLLEARNKMFRIF